MCRAPCCGTPADIKKLIEHGYADCLMLDDWPGSPYMLKPALKGHEAKWAPFEILNSEGCTFWIDGKCELHNLGLKPIQGKLAHHSLTNKENEEICDMLDEAWEDSDEVRTLINEWKELVGYEE